jgi:cytochrome c-type biogenesis protein CcmF
MVYAGSVEGTEEAVYRFNINPLVQWVWIGGVVLVLGGLVTMWPGGQVPARKIEKARPSPTGVPEPTMAGAAR